MAYPMTYPARGGDASEQASSARAGPYALSSPQPAALLAC